MKVRKAVGAIIKKDSRFLLCHKILIPKYNLKMDEWNFLRGGIEEGEDLKKALMRELEEETNTNKFKIIKHIGPFQFEFPETVKKITKHQAQTNEMFLVEFYGDEDELKPDNVEIDKLEWFTEEEVLSKLRYNEAKTFFKEKVLPLFE